MTATFRPLAGVVALALLSACNGGSTPSLEGVSTPGNPLPAPVVPMVQIGPVQALENSLTLAFPVTLSKVTSEPVRVTYTSQDGTAKAGSDYTAVTRTLTILAGETRGFAQVTVADDNLLEGDETLSVTISQPSNASLGANTTAIGTIQDDETPVKVRVGSAQTSEGQIGESRVLSFPVSLSRSSSVPVSVTFASSNGSALAGSDYTAANGQLSFSPGQVSKTVDVVLIGDEAVEPDENLQMQLSNATGALLDTTSASASGTIVNDDVQRSFSVDDAAANENAGPLNFTVRLSQLSGIDRTVRYATADGTAQAGSDYVAASGTLTVAAGQTSATLAVALLDDTLVEGSETLTLKLTQSGDTLLADDGEATGTLLDNDMAPPPPGPAANMDSQVLQDIPTFTRCDFLNREYCLFPWPNDWFTTADASTDTKLRINMNLLSMPKNSAGKPLDPTEWNRSDGFSPGQLILARIPGLDLKRTGAVPLTHIADSYREDQPVLVLDLGPAGPVSPTAVPARHLIWSEMDANLSKFTTCDGVKPLDAGLGLAQDGGLPGAEQFREQARALRAACAANPTPEDPSVDPGPALTIRPAVNFTPGHRYAVVLRNLKNSAGATIAAPAAFRIYRDRAPSNLPMVEGRRAHFEELFAALGRAGIERSELYLTWDFTVISDSNLTGRLVHIRNDALAKLGDTTPGDGIVQGTAPVISNITVTNNTGTGNTAREVRGVITVPSYMDRPYGNAGSKFYYQPSAAGLNGDGLPDINPTTATQQFDFLCRIPRRAFDNASDPTAATTGVPQRPSLYGHGLLGSKSEGGGQIGSIVQEVGMIYCATDWIGMASHDSDPTTDGPIDPVYRDPPFGDIANVATLLTDMSNFASLTDRLQQSFINFSYLGRAILHPDGFCSRPEFKVGDTCLIDRTALYYDGNSQGGIFGGSLTAMSPDIKAATLGVPGMNYSTLLQRSVDFDAYAAFFYASYRPSLDQQFVLSFIQMLWDRADNNGYAHRLKAGNPLPNTPEKRVMLHPAFGDHQVSMTTAEVMARTMGASLKCPAVVSGSVAQRGPAVLAGAHPAVTKEAELFPLISFNRRHHDDEPYYDIPCITSYPHNGNALVVWDSGPVVKADGSPRNDNGGRASGVATPPIDNRPPRPEEGYGGDPHEFPRSTAESRQMKNAFNRPDGGVSDTCGTGRPCVTREFNPAP